jgi:hypothetical protein
MDNARYKKYSINLDDDSRDQCGILASYLTVSMSGLIRILIRDAFEERQTYFGKQDNSQSCLTT